MKLRPVRTRGDCGPGSLAGLTAPAAALDSDPSHRHRSDGRSRRRCPRRRSRPQRFRRRQCPRRRRPRPLRRRPRSTHADVAHHELVVRAGADPELAVSQVTETVQSATNAVTGGTAGAAAGSTAGTAGGAVEIGERNRRAAHRRSGRRRPAGTSRRIRSECGADAGLARPDRRQLLERKHRARSGRSARGIVLGFVSYERGRLALPVVQISPPVVAWARSRSSRRGVNLIRFNGGSVSAAPRRHVRARHHRRCGSDSPSLPGVRRARSAPAAEHLPRGRGGAAQAARFRSGQPGRCRRRRDRAGDRGGRHHRRRAWSPADRPVGPEPGPRNDDRLGQERRHRPAPAFYLLLGMAIAALATATLPASAVPSPWLGATLARRRAELTRRRWRS